jgi:hypothetical protein
MTRAVKSVLNACPGREGTSLVRVRSGRFAVLNVDMDHRL